MNESLKVLLGLIGAVVTLGIFVVTVTFRMGHHSARIESLEKWRENVRLDMHEISDKLEDISKHLAGLTTLIQERTERRFVDRERHE